MARVFGGSFAASFAIGSLEMESLDEEQIYSKLRRK